MKRNIFWIILIFLFVILWGCTSSQNKVESDNKKQPWKNGEGIVVKGSVSDYRLHSLNFIDKNVGWLIKNIYMGNKNSSQLLKTVDGGKSWNTIDLNNLTLNKLFFVDKNSGWAISSAAGLDKSTVNKSGIIKILYTGDGGENWNPQWEEKAVLTGDYQLYFADRKHGFALLAERLLATNDGGKNWTELSFGVEGFIPQHLSFLDASTARVIGIVKGKQPIKNRLLVLKTNDGGQNWKQEFMKDYPADSLIGSIDIDFINHKTGWFLTSNLDTWRSELYYTGDSGQNWKKINEVKSVRPTPTELEFVTSKEGWIPLDVGAGPVAGGLLLTRDGGENFKLINNDGSLSSIGEIQFVSAKEGWAVGTEPNRGNYLVQTQDNGQSWEQVYPSLRPTDDISFLDDKLGFGLGIPADRGALLYTEDGGVSWQKIDSFSRDYRPVRISFSSKLHGWTLVAQRDSNKLLILESKDGGSNWETINGELPAVDSWSVVYFKLFNDNQGLLISKGKNVTFYTTRDGGQSWQKEVEKQSKAGIYHFSFPTMKLGWEVYNTQQENDVELNQLQLGNRIDNIATVDSGSWVFGTEFYAGDKGLILVEKPPLQADSIVKLLVTRDGGKSWATHPFPDDFHFETLSNYTPIQFTDQDHGWILSRWGILKTEDGGRSWSWQ